MEKAICLILVVIALVFVAAPVLADNETTNGPPTNSTPVIDMEIDVDEAPAENESAVPEANDSMVPETNETSAPINETVVPEINGTEVPETNETALPEVNETTEPEVNESVVPEVNETMEPTETIVSEPTVSITVRKASYYANETVELEVVSGDVVVDIVITDPVGQEHSCTGVEPADGFELCLFTQLSGIVLGEYKAAMLVDGEVMDTTLFELTAIPRITLALSVSTDKATYSFREPVEITVTTTIPAGIELVVVDPANQETWLECASNGCEVSFLKKSDIVLGEYTVTARAGEAESHATFFIEFKEQDKKRRKLAMRGKAGKVSLTLRDKITKKSVAIEKARGKYTAELVPENHPVKKIVFNDLDVDGDVDIGLDDVPETGRWVETYAIDPTRLNFTNATVTATAKGNALYKCRDWDFENSKCLGSWKLFKRITPGQNYTFLLTPDDPGFAEDITIINVQSYPTVGGNWEVRFTTNGTANLTVTAVDGTMWSDTNEDNDMKFLSLKCGTKTMSYTWIGTGPSNSSVFLEDYICNETGYMASKVLTSGKHALEFVFGSDTERAYNQAGWWNTSWKHRKELNITNNVGSVLQKGYSINMTVDTSALVSAGKMQSDCSDLRIVWWNDTDNIELDRVNETDCNSGSTEVWFKLQRNISASGYNESYYMYYENTGAGDPPTNKSNIYWLWEDFEDQAHPFSDGNLNPTVTSASKKNGNYGLSGNGAGGYRRAVKPESMARGMVIEGWMYSHGDGSNADLPGLEFGMSTGTEKNGYQAVLDWRSGSGGGADMQIRENYGSSSPLDSSTENTVAKYNWFYIRAIWDENGGINITVWNESMSVWGTMSASDATYTSGYYGVGAYKNGWWDDIKARLYFSSEPTVSQGTEEVAGVDVTMVSPSNGYESSSTSVTFNCSATSSSGLSNITLYGNWSGGWHANETKNISGTDNSTTFTKTITGGTYKWNCLAYNVGSELGWGNSNYTFTIDISPPTLTINSPSGTIADTTPMVNVSFGETVDSAWYNIDGGSNTTLCTGCSSVDDAYLDLAEGPYTIYVFANDTFGNTNNIESSAFTIDMDENYYDTYDDSSSISVLDGTTWQTGNVIFHGTASGWWNAAYEYRKQLNITNNDASTLESGHSINFTLNTSALVSAGKMQSDCSDLRIVWWNDTDNIELDRVNETDCNSGSTEVWFKLQRNISASGYNESYYMYYGNSGAGSPPANRSKVYLFWDDFEDGNDNGWTEHNGIWNVVSNEYYQSADLSTYMRSSSDAGSSAWDDYTLETKVKIASGGSTGGFAGVLFRFQDTNNHYAVILDDRSDDSICIRQWIGGSYTTSPQQWIDVSINRDTWYDLRVDVFDNGGQDTIRAVFNGITHEYNYTQYDSGTIALMMHGTQTYYDDIKVKKYLVSKPSVSALGEVYVATGGSGNFTSTAINTTSNITQVTNITWAGSNTDSNNNMTIEISVDNGVNWHTVTNGTGLSGFTEDNSLVYRVEFATNGTKTISLLDLNISWSYQGVAQATNSSLVKSITPVGTDVHEVNLTVTNTASESSFVEMYDFVPVNFAGSVWSTTYNGSASYDSGTVYCWNATLAVGGELSVTYNLTGSGDYNMKDTYLIGLDPEIVRGASKA